MQRLMAHRTSPHSTPHDAGARRYGLKTAVFYYVHYSMCAVNALTPPLGARALSVLSVPSPCPGVH